MSENVPQNPMDTENNDVKILQENRAYMITTYVFFFLGFGIFPILGPIIGVVMAYVKRQSVAGSIYASHCQWLIRTFWVTFCFFFLAFICSLGVLPSLLSLRYAADHVINPIETELYTYALMSISILFVVVCLSFVILFWDLMRLVYGVTRLLHRQDVDAKAWVL